MTTPQAPEAPPQPPEAPPQARYDVFWLQNLSFVATGLLPGTAKFAAWEKSVGNPGGDFLILTASMELVSLYRGGQYFLALRA